MKRFFAHFWPFEKYVLKTKMQKEFVYRKVDSVLEDSFGPYRGRFTKDGFVLAGKHYRSLGIGHLHNSFAPVTVARVEEAEGLTVVSAKA